MVDDTESLLHLVPRRHVLPVRGGACGWAGDFEHVVISCGLSSSGHPRSAGHVWGRHSTGYLCLARTASEGGVVEPVALELAASYPAVYTKLVPLCVDMDALRPCLLGVEQVRFASSHGGLLRRLRPLLEARWVSLPEDTSGWGEADDVAAANAILYLERTWQRFLAAATGT